MKRAKGFTLVELLVVIGIIALLISILLPTLSRARQTANSIACMSNLHQIYLALMIYADANQGSYPFGYWAAEPANNNIGTDWVPLTLHALTSKYGTNYQEVAPGNSGQATQTGNYSSTTSIRRLMVDTDTPQSDAVGSGITLCQYSVHPRIMPVIDPGNSGDKNAQDPYNNPSTMLTPYAVAKVKRPSEVVLVFCGSLCSENSGANPPDGAWWGALSVAQGLDQNEIIVGSSATGGGHGKGTGGGTTSTRTYLLHDLPGNQSDNGDFIDPGPNTDYIGDCVNLPGWSGYTSDPYESFGQPRWRHMNNTVCNFAYCDGHVESHHYKQTGIGTGTCDLLRAAVNVNFK